MRNREYAATAINRHRDNTQGILYISAGLPGAGKSTFLKKIKNDEEVIVSRDEIRFSLLKEGEDYFSHEDEVFDIFIQRIIDNLLEGKNVYADATHLTPQSQLKLLAPILLKAAPPRVDIIYFTTPLYTCLKRNEQRKGTQSYCPSSTIKKMDSYKNYSACSYVDKIWEVNENGEVSSRKR